ncbi:hypothetical protein CQW23_03393 [Capsicum baccatum]|uniref:PHD finger protein ALFIN-LIKE n=1 Tax=Capsicum baccatum TaxID=33114 RepID=A0A2G2XBP7_CAPBA|nr:hypothetical protein CQW23_03393 [Capsicum baccatum]
MDNFLSEMRFQTVDEAFKNYLGRRQGIIKVLKEDVDKFREKCDELNVTIVVHSLFIIFEILQKVNERTGLYAFPNGNFEIKWPAHMTEALPHSRLYKLPKEEKDKNAWLAQVAANSDTLLFSVTFYLCSIYEWGDDWRELLFDKMNELPTIYESVIGNEKNQGVATENAKKLVKDKSIVSYHNNKNSKSNSEVPGKSSSRVVSPHKVLNSAKVTGDVRYISIKDLKCKWEGKKAAAITFWKGCSKVKAKRLVMQLSGNDAV